MANTDGKKRRLHGGRLIVVLTASLLFAPGCHTMSDFRERTNAFRAAIFETGYEDPRAPEKMAEADRLFEQGEYGDALSEYRSLADNQRNPADLAERARFMQAECRYMKGEYPDAADTYHKMLLDFPTGIHRRDACERIYQICDFWLDDFRDELARRSDEEGILYWHPEWKNPFDKKRPWVGQESRTLEALDRVWTHDMNGPTADKALFWCGYVNFVRGNFEEADHYFSTLAEFHKESPLRAQAITYAIHAKNNATGGPAYDNRKAAEALQLVYEAEASVPEATQDPEMAAKMKRAKIAIRSQQAEKDLGMARYYQRTGHPGSAVFYYELVKRRYSGTQYAEVADAQKEMLLAKMRAGKPDPGIDPVAILQAKWDELVGNDTSAVVPAEGEVLPDDEPAYDQRPAPPLPPAYGGSAGGAYPGY